jgi:hypothetical protein
MFNLQKGNTMKTVLKTALFASIMTLSATSFARTITCQNLNSKQYRFTVSSNKTNSTGIKAILEGADIVKGGLELDLDRANGVGNLMNFSLETDDYNPAYRAQLNLKEQTIVIYELSTLQTPVAPNKVVAQGACVER